MGRGWRHWVMAAILAAALPAAAQVTDYAALGKVVVGEMAAGQFRRTEARYTAAVAAGLPTGRLAAIWKQVQAREGAYDSIQAATVVEAGGAHSAVVTCKFARASFNVIITFDGDGRVAGLRLAPANAAKASAWTPPAYAQTDRFHEEAVTVGASPWTLPGTLTLPAGPGPFAAVVLVHGSGPEDADETIGPNKPFKDLAWGLASQGIAVLRYVKRTRQYGAQPHTVKDEATDDAQAAVALLAGRADINPKAIYVLGHSEGGYLAPRIAQGDTDVAGIISLAGEERPLVVLVLDQLHYFAGLQAQPSVALENDIQLAEKAQAEIDSPTLKPGATVDLVGVPMPGSYFLDLRGYRPAQVAAGLQRPILVLQGGRDYQVTAKDYDGWKSGLSRDPLATFKFYPTLDHLFMTGGAPPQPADYARPGHVDENVIHDIAAWVAGGGEKPVNIRLSPFLQGGGGA